MHIDHAYTVHNLHQSTLLLKDQKHLELESLPSTTTQLKPALSIPLVASNTCAARPGINTAPATLLAAAAHLDTPRASVTSACLTTVCGAAFAVARNGEGS
jgi:hypothetical protein